MRVYLQISGHALRHISDLRAHVGVVARRGAGRTR
jgi:hypothetical protein